jgi:YHS domain-containing protein
MIGFCCGVMSAIHVKMRADFCALLAGAAICTAAFCVLLPGKASALDSAALSQAHLIKATVIMDSKAETALFGFDAVAFHTEGRARLGKAQHAVERNGQVWRFATEANLAAFAANPDAFLPAFGGHDPVSITDGFLTSGDPENFLMLGEAVFFFRSVETKQRFKERPEIFTEAKGRWPEVFRQNALH